MDDNTEQRRIRAYHLWERDGRPHGRHDDHWSEAEGEHNTGEVPAAAGRVAGADPKAAKQPGEGLKPKIPSPVDQEVGGI